MIARVVQALARTAYTPLNTAKSNERLHVRREYEGKLSQRINVQSMQPLDYAADSRVLLSQIEKLTVHAA